MIFMATSGWFWMTLLFSVIKLVARFFLLYWKLSADVVLLLGSRKDIISILQLDDVYWVFIVGWCSKISSCRLEVIHLRHQSEALLAKMSDLKDQIMKCQRQRQKEIWRLLALIASEVSCSFSVYHCFTVLYRYLTCTQRQSVRACTVYVHYV